MPLNWEALLEQQDSKYLKSDGNSGDLLQFIPLSANAIDEQGAVAAKIAAPILHIAIAEPFYVVHSKAQRKVPIPEELNIDSAISQSAMKKLFAVDTPKNISLSSLQLNLATNGAINNSLDLNISTHVVNISNVGDSKENYIDSDQYKHASIGGVTDSGDSTFPNTFISQNRNPEESLFYLQSSSKAGSAVANVSEAQPISAINPLSLLLADSFDDTKQFRRKAKHSKRGSSKFKDINKKEMLPAGATLDSDDEAPPHRRRNKLKESIQGFRVDVSLDYEDCCILPFEYFYSFLFFFRDWKMLISRLPYEQMSCCRSLDTARFP